MEPFLGEIRMFAGNFAPLGWVFCDGRLLPINEYDAVFALIGTTYGGDGVTTFGVPDLRSRVPVHTGSLQGGSNYPLGSKAGVESVTLTRDQLAGHTHATRCNSGDGTVPTPAGDVWAGNADFSSYSSDPANALMNSASVTPAGGSQPHDNMPPFQVVNFIICLEGIFPSRS